MDYEEKYKSALKWMQSLYSGLHGATKEEAEKYFPELKESEDEKMRKSIIYALQNGGFYSSDKTDEAIAWLEKQGEQKSVDKFEPKFKVADWVVWKDKCYKVNYNGCGYELVDQNGLSTSLEYGTIDKGAHLWDITKDAKDGDALVASDGSIFLFAGVDDCACKYYVALTTDNCLKINKEVKGGYWETSRAVYPATKEQRDLLFQKMANASYEWYAEKKELRKIESKTLDAAKVIEWIKCEEFQGWAEPIDIRPIIRKFKKDFGL